MQRIEPGRLVAGTATYGQTRRDDPTRYATTAAWTVVGSCEGDGDEPCDCPPCRQFAASAVYAPALRWGWTR